MIDLNTFYVAVVAAFLIGALVAWLFARVNGRRRNERYEAQIGALQGRLARREQELAEVQARASALESELANETYDNQTLRHDLSLNRDELDTARDTLVAVRHELEVTAKAQDALQQTVARGQSEIDQLNGELTDAYEQLGRLRTHVEDLVGRNATLERTLAETQAALAASTGAPEDADALQPAMAEPATVADDAGQEVPPAHKPLQDDDTTRTVERGREDVDVVAVEALELWSDDAVTRELGMGLADAKAEMDRLRRSLSVLTSVSAEMATTLSQRNRQYERVLVGIQAAASSRMQAASAPGDGVQPTQRVVLVPGTDVMDDESALAAVEAMRARHMELQRHVEELVTARNGLQTQLAEREASLGASRLQLNALNGELAGHASRRAELEATLAAREDELGQLRRNWAELEARVEEADAARGAAESAVADRETLLADLQARIDEVDAARVGLDSLLQARETSLVQLQENLATRSEEVQQLHALAAQKDDDLAAHTTRLDGLVTQVAGLQSDLYATSAGKAEVEGALAEREANVAMLQDQVGALKTELERAAVAKADLDAQLAERDATLSDLDAQLREVAEARSGAESVAARAQEELAAKHAEFDAARADLMLQLDALQGQKAALSDQVQSLVQQVQEAQRALDATKAEVQARQEELVALQAQKSSVDAELGQAHAEVERIDKQSAAQIAAFTAAAAATSKRIDSLEQERDALKAEIEQLRTRLDTTLADKEAVDAALQARQSLLDTTTAQLDAANEQLTALAQERDLAARRAADMDMELTEARSRIDVTAALYEAMPETRALTLDVGPLPAAKQGAAAEAIAAGRRPIWAQASQKLTEVRGIDRVFEQRLLGNRIGTYWELASLSDEEYVRILDLSDPQRQSTDLDAIRRAALHLARETNTIGHLWVGSTVDDFESIPGIGKTVEQRLYQAGILTYEDLANEDVDRLAEIVRAPELSAPDYGAWLAKARELSRARQSGPEASPSEDGEVERNAGDQQ